MLFILDFPEFFWSFLTFWTKITPTHKTVNIYCEQTLRNLEGFWFSFICEKIWFKFSSLTIKTDEGEIFLRFLYEYWILVLFPNLSFYLNFLKIGSKRKLDEKFQNFMPGLKPDKWESDKDFKQISMLQIFRLFFRV